MPSTQKPALVDPLLSASPRILIIDDTSVNLGVIITSLENCGYRLVIAQEGSEGLQRAAFVKPDLILLDVMMPGMDGFEVCRRLKTNADTADIPVIFMTALAETEHKIAGFKVGGVDYITKPIQIDEVIARVDKHLNLRALQRQLQAHQVELEQRVMQRTAELNASNRLLRKEIEVRKRLDEERLSHLHFFENMDRINQAIQGTNDLDTMMSNVLDVMLSIFDCDRAFLAYPCDPEADSWIVPFESTRPEYPGALTLGLVMPMDADVATTFRILLDADGPVTQGPGNQYSLPRDVSKQFGFKSYMATVFYPKGDKPWTFGIHQCSRARIWTPDEKKLLQEIGRRLADALTGLLAYRSLQVSEQEYRTLVENAPHGIARYDLQGRISYFNPTLEKVLHITTAEARGKRPTECFSQDYYEDYEKTLLQVAASGEPTEFELQYPGTDGLEVGIITIVAERGPDGEIVGVLAIGFDITKQRRLEMELIRSEREFRSLAESSPDNISRYDRQGRLIYMNHRLEQTLGVSSQALLGKTAKESNPGGDYDEYQAKIEAVIKTGRNDEMELTLPDKVNGLRYYHIRFVTEYGPDGEIIGVLAMGRNFTQKRLMELELIRREREFRTLAENSPDSIIRYDLDCRRTYVNQAYEIATNTKRANIIGKTPLDDWHLEVPNADEYTKILRRVMATRKAERVEVQLFDADGSPHYFSMHFVPEYNEHDEINGVLSFATDITELKTAERRRVEASKQAERQLRKFSAHLQAVREKEKTSFAREIHDNLGGTLAALKMDLNWLMDELSEIEETSSLLKHIESMSQLLDNAAVATRQVITDLRPPLLDDFGLSAALEWQAEQFHKRTGIQCRVACDESCSYELDKTQTINLFRIFQESLTNVVRHSGASRVEVELQHKNAAVILTISDNGCGLPKGHIIAPTSYGMLGMRERTEQLGGRINFYSPPGGGFSITVMLPQVTKE
ncbi:MAG: PAS domain S-box protein [Methylobacter sp.]|nr:MAG: PAS domain S-box protein [Methylobacter sp.]